MQVIKILLICGLIACFGLIGCGDEKADTTNDTEAASSSSSNGYFKADGVSVTFSDSTYNVAGVSFNPPAGWRDEGTTSMRKAQFSFGPEEGDTDSATVIFFYFGEGGGGGTQANIDRWIAQVSQTDGSDSKAKATQNETTLSGLKAHVVEVTGNYAVGGMGMATGSATGEGYLMVAVVLEGPEGNLFIKLTGQEKTAAKMASQFAFLMENLNR